MITSRRSMKINVDPDFVYKLDQIKKKIKTDKSIELSRPNLTRLLAQRLDPDSFDLGIEFVRRRKRLEKIKGTLQFEL